MIGLTDLLGRMSMRAVSAAAIGLLALSISTTGASAETRVLRLYNLHTKEKVSIAYKKDGRYIPSGLKELNWFLRDWRKKQPTTMDKRLLDLIWEAYRQSGSRDYIHVVCGFRSPDTNNMLRSRSAGVAKESQHTLGRAMDFYIPDVPLKKMREIGLRMEVGGVGYYPTSGSPFVHFDVGNVRHWPRMSRKELVAVFPKGNTIHVPSDGKPLPGYAEALASYKQRKGASSIEVANASSSSSSGSSRGGGKTLLAALFGGGSDEEEDVADVEVAAADTKPAPKVEVKRIEEKRQPVVAMAALVPVGKSKLLASGVPLPLRDTFDTSAPIPSASVGREDARQDKIETGATEVASLDVARIPIPHRAPQREVPVPGAPVPGDEVSALVAAMEASPSAKEIGEAAAPAEMAYAVPMPRSRPPFEAVLSAGATKGAEGVDVVKEIASAVVPTPSASAVSAVAALAAAPSPMVPEPAHALSVVPAERPITVASMTGMPMKSARAPRQNLLLASNPAPKHALLPMAAVREAIPAGKTSRLARQASTVAAATARKQTAPASAQNLIQSRIEMASIVADPAARAAGAMVHKPKADALVRDIPTSVFTAGFATGAEASGSNSFSGSAVRFLPVAKFD